MDNNGSSNSKTSIFKNDGKGKLTKRNGNNWEQVHLTAAESGACNQEDLEGLENGLSSKVMRFIGLPRSYTHTLYNDFVHEVKQIPAETATSLLSIVSWVWGQSDGESDDIRRATISKKSDLGEGDASPSSESIVHIASRFGNLDKEENPLEVDVIDDPNDINASLSTPENETVEQEMVKINICSPKRPASETSTYQCEVLESENDEGHTELFSPPFSSPSSESEKEVEEMKRVKFASPPDETSIYAYQDEGTYQEGPQTDSEDKMNLEENVFNIDFSYEDLINNNVTINEDETADQTDFEKSKDWNNNNDIMKDSPPPKTVQSRYKIKGGNVERPKDSVIEADGEKVRKVASSTKTSLTKDDTKVCSKEMKKPIPSTSEVQLQLNNDLKTLEQIVKKLYINLDRKGPVTIVAKFNPTNDEELALDSDSLTDKSAMKPAPSEGSKVKCLQKNTHQRKQPLRSTTSQLQNSDFMERVQRPATVSSMKKPNSKSSPASHQQSSLPTKKNHVNFPEPTSSLKPAIKRSNHKMSSLCPATSSHSVVSKKEVNNNAALLNSSRSKKQFSKNQPVTPQHFTIRESPDYHNRFLVPVSSDPKQHFVSSSSKTSTAPYSQSQRAMPVDYPQRFILATPNSKHIHIDPTTPRIVMEAPYSQQVLLEPPQSIQHILVENPPPPTCQNPHLHPRTATILAPPLTGQFHMHRKSSQRGSHRYQVIQPCNTPTHHYSAHPENGHRLDSATESASNISMVSSLSSNGEMDNVILVSEGETDNNIEEQRIPVAINPIHLTSHTAGHQNRPVTRKPSNLLHQQEWNKQSTENTDISSSTRQFRTTLHIPRGTPKQNSYKAIFKEKQRQTFYVDLTSKGLQNKR